MEFIYFKTIMSITLVSVFLISFMNIISLENELLKIPNI